MIDLPTIIRQATIMGHEGLDRPDQTCPVCGLSADDMMKLGRIPKCEAGRWLARASRNEEESDS